MSIQAVCLGSADIPGRAWRREWGVSEGSLSRPRTVGSAREHLNSWLATVRLAPNS